MEENGWIGLESSIERVFHSVTIILLHTKPYLCIEMASMPRIRVVKRVIVIF